MGCRAQPPRVTPERSMTVVVDAIIVVRVLRARVHCCLGVGSRGCFPAIEQFQRTLEQEGRAGVVPRADEKVWWSCDVDGRLRDGKICFGELWCGVWFE